MTLPAIDRPYRLALIGGAVAVVLAPLFCYEFDVFQCWVAWGTATGGLRPWGVYRGPTRYPCNYPPVLPYLWTATAAARRWVPVLRHRALTLELVKLPNILAWLAGVAVCDRGLRRAWGERPARAAAVAYAVCLPLLIDAAVWGQYDAILSLAMVGAVVALIAGRPVLAGAVGGLALGIKFQAVVIVPAAAVYAWRRFGPARTAAAVGAAAGVLAVVSAPFVIAGQGRAVVQAYTQAVDFYPALTMNAANVWQPVRLVNRYVRHQTEERANDDAVHWAGPVTPKRIGLTLFAAYAAAVAAGLWRRPDGPTLARAAALSAFGFFMLPTQMHERYLVPAAALLAVSAGFGRADRWIYVGVAASAAAQLAVQQYHESVFPAARLHRVNRLLDDGPLAVLSGVDLALFAWASARYAAAAWAAGRAEPPEIPASNIPF